MRYLTTACSFLYLFLLLCGPAQATADPGGAKAYIGRITGELERALQQGKAQGLLDNEAFLDAVIDRHVIPHVDREYLSQRVFHPRWADIVAERKAERAQNAVISSLRRTYRLALSAYNGQSIEIRNSRHRPDYSVVRTFIHTADKGHVIDFALRQTEGRWRVFDLSVDGVVVSKTLNGAIQRSLASEGVDAIINAIDPQGEPRQTPRP